MFFIQLDERKADGRPDELAQSDKQGHEDARLYIYNNVVRVILGSFATESEAYKKLNRIQQEEGLEDAWIYKMKS